MPAKWSTDEKVRKYDELIFLYIDQNKTIREVAKILGIGESTVYDRLVRLGISSQRSKKERYNNIRQDIFVPVDYSPELAEFTGILLGDGHLNPTQVMITLGRKDEYVDYVVHLIHLLFTARAKVLVLPKGHFVVYIGSTVLVRWFLEMGLCFNKVKSQVDVPRWIFSQEVFMRAALRGLFDTDGSVYRLKFGTQISFCNKSKPLIRSVRKMLVILGFSPSRISGSNLYLTKKSDLDRFFLELGFKNKKHEKRFLEFFHGRVA